MDSSFNATPHYQEVRHMKIQRFTSPLLEKTGALFEQRRRAKESLKWGTLNLILFCLCYFRGIQVGFWFLFHIHHSYVILLEFIIGALFALNSLFHVYNYLSPALMKDNIVLSPKQRVLLGVDKEDRGFIEQTELTESVSQSSPTAVTPVLMPRRRRTNQSSPSPVGSPCQGSIIEYGRESPPGSGSPRRTDLIIDRSPSTPGQLDSSPRTGSPASRVASNKLSPPSGKLGSNDTIKDMASLDKYLKDQEELDLKLKRAQLDTTPNSRQSFWTYGRSAYDFIPSPGQYQIASRSTQSPSSKDDDFESGFIKYEETWKKIGVHADDLDFWRENLRKWLAETVIERLVTEINTINEKLVQLGCSELQIGNVSVSSLRNMWSTKSKHLPSLKSVIPYLDITANQEYLVNRIQELAEGGCLRTFKWNSGGLYKGKPWNQDLPTDAQIVLHLFCTYLDTHLPSNPRYPDGKSFSGLHFLKTPSKPSERKSDICIFQSRTHPPHFKVLQGDEVYDLPRGRNNLFHAILIFLYFVKIYNYGMVGRVNFGLTGINILWVINKK